MVSFAHTTHHEATDPRRVFVPAAVREFKYQTAPGEVLSKLLSDRGSIPLTSTKQVKGEPISLGRWIRLYRLFLSIHTSKATDGFPPVALLD